jgi:hypothetical protein
MDHKAALELFEGRVAQVLSILDSAMEKAKAEAKMS